LKFEANYRLGPILYSAQPLNKTLLLTDGVTLFFPKKTDDLFFLSKVHLFIVSPPPHLPFPRRLYSVYRRKFSPQNYLISFGCHPLDGVTWAVSRHWW